MTIEDIQGGERRPAGSPPRHMSWLLPATAVLALTAGMAIGRGTVDPPDPAPPPSMTPYPLSGTIIFGPLTNPSSRLSLDQELVWAAFLSGPVHGSYVNVAISQRSDADELFAYTEIVNPGILVSAGTLPVGRFIGEPGHYLMRYFSTRTGETLAEGEFELIPQSS